MPRSTDSQRFKNEDLLLRVSSAVDRTRWDESRYEAFIDELCGYREYQKGAIRVALRYLLANKYRDLRELAKENFEQNDILTARYGSWSGMERQLQIPDRLSASLDLATGTGKSYVLYGIAAILLAEGVVDKVLVLCPSTTIEDGLLNKFKRLAATAELRDLLPSGSRVSTPSIINASQTITDGSICVENYHAVFEHVRSSIRESLKYKGERVAVLNDEAHHVANETATNARKWKEFLTSADYNFRYIMGVSGTCYVNNDYFSDVIYRYSLRQAIEDRYVKQIEYVDDMPQTGNLNEKWQLIRNKHEDIKRRLQHRGITPLTIIITKDKSTCLNVFDEFKAFLIDDCSVTLEAVEEQVIYVYSGQSNGKSSDLARLPYVDQPGNKVEWLFSVSMLNEGWDVKRVFQIVPHEERAFNSKLLIAQVLGRGLRVPEGWEGPQPEVTVFNHDAWAPRIKQLVNEIMEIEKRLSSQILDDSEYHFDIHNIDYTLETKSIKKPMDRPFSFFEKGYVDLATELSAEDVSIEFERASTGQTYFWQTQIQRKTFTPREIACAMYDRLEESQTPDDPDPEMRTSYTDEWTVEKLEIIVKASLGKLNTEVATESMKQKFLQSLGTLRRKASEFVRYTPIENKFQIISTKSRQANSVSAAELCSNKTVFYTNDTRSSINDEQLEFYEEAIEPGSGFKCVPIQNPFDFKTPLNLVIADSDNEKKFIRDLIHIDNARHYDKWVKSTAMRFYEIDYAWKKGAHPKRGKFSPDFFIKKGDLVIVVEVKGDEELREPSPENIKKNEYALAHYKRVNNCLEKGSSPVRYKFTFLSECSFSAFFQKLREGDIENFYSALDVRLIEENE